jgi:hypothetical protein
MWRVVLWLFPFICLLGTNLSLSPTVAPSKQPGELWLKVDSNLYLNWLETTVSDSGQYLIGATKGNKLYYSSDFGLSWVQSAGGGINEWYALAASSSGQYAVSGGCMVGATTIMYYSFDFGHTWLQSGSPSPSCWSSAAISSSGQYVLAGPYSGYLHRSEDYGVTYMKCFSVSSIWKALAMDSSGQYVVAGADAGLMYHSSDFGNNWVVSTLATSYSWRSACMSSNGKYVTAGIFSYISNENALFYSSDYGHTWTASGGTSGLWRSLATTHSGQFLVAVNYNKTSLYYSRDYGHTWEESPGTDGAQGWRTVSINNDATYMVGTKVPAGYLYYNSYSLTQTVSRVGAPMQAPQIHWSGTPPLQVPRRVLALLSLL